MAGKRQKHPGQLQGHRKVPSLVALPSRAERAWTRDELEGLTRETLRGMAAKRRLHTGGLKADLVNRLLEADVDLSVPDLPAVTWPEGTDWHPMARRRWREMWGSDVAGSWEKAADGGRLTRYIVTFDRWLKLSELMVGREAVMGSRGQVRANPLFNVLAGLEIDLRTAEEKFGMTPMDRMRLGIEIGGAAAGLRDAAEIMAEQAMAPDEWAAPDGWQVEAGR